MSQLVSVGSDFWNFESIFLDKMIHWCTNLDTPTSKGIKISQRDGAQTEMSVACGQLTFRSAVGTPRPTFLALSSVEFVADHWMPRCRKMHADLMCPPGKRMYFEQSRIRA